MGLIFWIDENTFATSLLEKVFKKKGLPFYTIKEAKDFTYLIEDLRPEVIVLDGQTARKNLELFKSEYLSSETLQKLPFILIDGEIDFIKKKLGKIERPFDPFEIPKQIDSLLKAQ